MSAADKDDLRNELLTERRALTDQAIESARAAVRAHVLAEVARSAWRTVAAYVPLRTEPGSVDLLDALAEAGLRVLVPLVLADRDLDWTLWAGPASGLGVDAVAPADLVLVPALAVGADGTRLGRGGGSYDRALRRVPAGRPVVALLYDAEVRSEVPREPWDVPVTAYVTPRGWYPIGLRNS